MVSHTKLLFFWVLITSSVILLKKKSDRLHVVKALSQSVVDWTTSYNAKALVTRQWLPIYLGNYSPILIIRFIFKYILFAIKLFLFSNVGRLNAIHYNIIYGSLKYCSKRVILCGGKFLTSSFKWFGGVYF